MNAEELVTKLNGIAKLEHEIARLRWKAKAFGDLATQTTAMYGGEAVKHSRNMHSMEDLIIEKVYLENKADEMQEQLHALKQKSVQLFSECSRLEYTQLLQLRYIDHLSWNAIAVRLNTNKTNIIRWHRKALDELVRNEEILCC